MRRSPRSARPCLLERLSSELLALIGLELDLASLFDLRCTSKAWKAFIDSDLILGQVCVQEGHLQKTQKLSDESVVSHLRSQGYTQEDVASYASLLQAKVLRRIGLPFRTVHYDDPLPEHVPSRRKNYDFLEPTVYEAADTEEHEGNLVGGSHSCGVHAFQVDHIDQVLVTTSEEGGGLRVTCLESGALLWYDRYVCDHTELQISQGIAVTCDPQDVPWGLRQLQLWRFDRLVSSEATARRGHLHKGPVIQCPRSVKLFRFHHPYLVVLTRDLHLVVFEETRLLDDFDVTPTIEQRPCQSWSPVHLEFDDDYYFVLLVQTDCNNLPTDLWCLQVFSRQSKQLVWTFNDTDLYKLVDRTNPTNNAEPRMYEFTSSHSWDETEELWDNSAKLHQLRSQDPANSDKGSREHEDNEAKLIWGGKWLRRETYNGGLRWLLRGKISSVAYDSTTETLCLLCGMSLTVFPRYKQMIQKPQFSDDKPIVLWFSFEGDIGEEGQSLCISNGVACFTFDQAIMMVDLRRVLSGETSGCVARFRLTPPETQWMGYLGHLTKIQLTESMLAFKALTVCREYGREVVVEDERTYVGIFDFTKLAWYREHDPRYLILETHGVVWPLKEVEVGEVEEETEEEEEEEETETDED